MWASARSNREAKESPLPNPKVGYTIEPPCSHQLSSLTSSLRRANDAVGNEGDAVSHAKPNLQVHQLWNCDLAGTF
jgi:hypothetical protein